jgi:hypothetical protein
MAELAIVALANTRIYRELALCLRKATDFILSWFTVNANSSSLILLYSLPKFTKFLLLLVWFATFLYFLYISLRNGHYIYNIKT